ncbi:hypothetical protein PDESU_05520 [Pontiella desulfatans]|uniref:EF-hand domain-containing protein n=1 Tax=Pontiella desulfatans TaxID=2750659 RepID=A0A6C2UBB6_PONDE|nr:hypothetical protein [Pontiella desulfatans]VGO16927.1 hypothetical protein PDESU_05520 [Pontiella desulfatans]
MKKNLHERVVMSLSLSFALTCATLQASAAAPSNTFQDMDQDADERVSKDEFMAYGKNLKETAGKPFDEAAAGASFDKRDTDQDGYLSPAELAAKKPPQNKKMTLAEQKQKIEAAKKAKAEEEAKKKKEEEKKKEERKRLAEKKKDEKNKSNDDGDDD